MRDKYKLNNRRDELDRDIKRLKGELDEAVRQKQRVEYDLEDMSVVRHENTQAISAALISKYDAECIQRDLFGFVPNEFKAVKSTGIIHLYNQKLVAPKGLYYIFQTRKDYVFQRVYECDESVDTMFHKFARDDIMRYDCAACSGNERKVKVVYDWPLCFVIGEFKGSEKAWNLRTLCICDKCNAHRGEGYCCPRDYYMRKYQQEYNKIMHYPSDLRLLLCARSRQADSPFHGDNMPLDVFKIIVRLVFPASFLTIK